MTDHVTFIDNDVSSSNRVLAAWLNAVNNLTYRGTNPTYATSAGTADAQTLTISAMSSLATLTAGMMFTFKVGAALTNTTATTLTINSFAAKNVTNADGSALTAGQLAAGMLATVMYDGTQYQLMNATNAGVFKGSTLSLTGQLTSTLATGTAPFVVASTTAVTNLNASLLLGSTWAAPGSIGSGTPAAGAFTTLSSSGLATLAGAAQTRGTTASTGSGTPVSVINLGGLSAGVYIVFAYLPNAGAQYEAVSIYSHDGTNSAQKVTWDGANMTLNSSGQATQSSGVAQVISFSYFRII